MADLVADEGQIAAFTRSRFVSAQEMANGLQTPLGTIETWSSGFKSAFAILLSSDCPMFLVWSYNPTQSSSEERILFYNNAYFSLLQETQHLTSLGQLGSDGWAEDWNNVQADIEQVLTTGQALRREKSPFLTAQDGNSNKHLYTWSYSAVWDETSQIRGVFATGYRVTAEEIIARTPIEEPNFPLDLVGLDGQRQDLWEESNQTQAIPMPKIAERIHRDDRHQVAIAINAALDPSSVGTDEMDDRISEDDDTEQWISSNGQVHFEGEGESQQSTDFFDTALSISKGNRDHESRQGEQRLQLAQQVGRIGTWEWNLLTNEVTWSDGIWTLLALEPNSITPNLESFTRFIHPDDREQILNNVVVALAQEDKHTYYNEFRIIRQDGIIGWLLSKGRITRGHNGQAEKLLGINVDITDRKQAEDALRQSEERLRLAQRAAGAGLWDWDIVLNNVTWSEEYYRLYGLDTTVTPSYENWLASVIESDRQGVEKAVREALEQQINLNIEFRILHPSQGICWITAIGQTFYDGSGQPIRMTGIVLNITDRKQAELEREQLLLWEQATREAAEVAEQRARFLIKVSTTLTSSLDYESTLLSVAQAVVPTLADWCAVDILKDDGTLERLATTHVDPAKVQWGIELHHRYPSDLNAPRGIAQVLRTGQSEYYPMICDDQIVAAAQDEEHLRILREIGFSSVMLVPLNARGKTLGTISFVAAESGRSYSLNDLSLAEELARRAAIALDNAHLYREAQQARQTAERAADRTARLQAVTAALSESLTPEQVIEVIVEQSMATLEATAALVVLVSNDRRDLEIVKSIGYQTDLVESWRRFSIDLDVPLAEAIRTGKPAWVETLLERIERYPHLAEVYSRYDFKSWIAIPLVVEGRSVGGMLLSFKEFKHLSQEDREFILALSRQCAQAIVRAQLYTAEQQARAEAEQANRTKDEFLAVLSHELRTPLNPILGWAKLLQTRQFDELGTKRALETIERNAKLQTQLIDDLLDVSRILSGKMMLNVCDINLVTVIDAALETVHLSAEAKGINIHKVVVGDMEPISGDSGRLQQVVWNLLSNAVKFTLVGGQVDIRLQQVGVHAQVQVKDTGKGITPEFLPHVFEHFRQEDGTTTRTFGGLGLGLAIVRYLTELHGGTVQAESPGEGLGATFTVLLPISKNRARATSKEASNVDTFKEASNADADTFPLANLRILVVDDEADMRELALTILKQARAKPKVVASAIEALNALDEFKPDILISDVGMPEMDGYALMRQVRTLPPERGGRIPAIALTAYAGEINQQQALAAGFQRHFAKPIAPGALVTAITTLVKARSQETGCDYS